MALRLSILSLIFAAMAAPQDLKTWIGRLPSTVPVPRGAEDIYDFEMVGTSPIAGYERNVTTTVDVVIVPLIFVNSDGSRYDALGSDSACLPNSSALGRVLTSPIFQDTEFKAGPVTERTQYIDFFQRTNFWLYAKPGGPSQNYHLRLNPVPVNEQVINVPAGKGSVRAGSGGCNTLVVDNTNLDGSGYFLSGQLALIKDKLVAQNRISNNQHLAFLTHNVVSTINDNGKSACCALGFHSAYDKLTYSISSYGTSSAFNAKDISTLSHELAEWVNNPFVNNATPPWGNTGQVTGCQSNLEVGDPIKEVIPVGSYHVQEQAFASWFYNPSGPSGRYSTGVNGWYSSNGTFTTAAAPCGSTASMIIRGPQDPNSDKVSYLNNLPFGTAVLSSTTGARTVRLYNNGGASLTNLGVSITGANPGDFTLLNGCDTIIPPTGQCWVEVRFRPTAAGSRTALLKFTADNLKASTGYNSVTEFPLTGTGALIPFSRVFLNRGQTSGCPDLPSENTFRPVHFTVFLSAVISLPGAGEITSDWLTPDGTVLPGEKVSRVFSGDVCLKSAGLRIDNLPPHRLGKWQSRVYYNGTPLFQVPFTVTDPTYTSLAVGKPAAQTDSSSNSTGFMKPAHLAVDGDLDGTYSNGSVTHTNFSNPTAMWWVDLGTSHQIRGISVWGRTDCCHGRLNGAKVAIWADGTSPGNGTPVWTGTIGTLPAPTGKTQLAASFKAGAGLPANDGHTGRYVSVQLPGTGDGTLSLAEVQVFGTLPAPTLAPAGAILNDADVDVTLSSPVNLAGATVRWEKDSVAAGVVVTDLAPQPDGSNLKVTIPASLLAFGSFQKIVVTLPNGIGLTPAPFRGYLQPAITALAPAEVTAGAAAFTLDVTGRGFTEQSVVRWNGVDRPTTYVSFDALKAQISAADVAAAATAAVTVFGPVGAVTAAATFKINAPAPPSITSLSPSNVNAGSAAFNLDVTGANFTAQSVVRWNGVARPTGLLSATGLRAQISAGDVATAGTATVTVFGPGNAVSGGATFTINAVGPAVGPPANPAPADGATGVSTSAALVWTAAANAASYDVYFGTAATPPLATTVAVTGFNPGSLAANTTYFWRVVAKSGAATNSGPVWRFTTGAPVQAGDLIPFGSGWKYLVTPTDQGSAWRALAFNDSAWPAGNARLGYGDVQTTDIGFGPDPNNKFNTTYFRRTFTIGQPSQIPGLLISLIRDDGAVVYLNGTEVVRSNMPDGVVSYATPAASGISAPDETAENLYTISSSLLVPGTNVIAVEVHQATANSSDLGFDLKLSVSSAPVSGGLKFVPVTPCRVADTRAGGGFSGSFGPPTLEAGVTRNLPIPAGVCGIPATAKAYSVNVTVVPSEPLAYLTLWPTGQPQPLVSTLNSFHGGVVANAAIVPAGTGGSVSVFVTNRTDVILDVNGYFDDSAAAPSYSFYAVDPCRLADTRTGSGFGGSFGAPTPTAATTRSFPLAGSCGLPAAAAYSLNVTVVPPGPLSYLTIFPAGAARPLVSTLNSFDGAIVANAAIVPAGAGGTVSTFVTDRTDQILDVNGYFGAAGGANELKFQPVTPCRIADTRLAGQGAPIMNAGSQKDFPVAGLCGVPADAKAYSFNVTVVPTGPLAFLTLWPSAKPRPLVSTLNSFAGRVVANAAISPAGTSGNVSVFVTDQTHVILDINGYFR